LQNDILICFPFDKISTGLYPIGYMKRVSLKQIARRILEQSQYMTLGTVNPDGRAWVSPVVYFTDNKYNFYFMSLPDSKHCMNIARDRHLSVAIFDSHQDLGQGVGLQMEAEAKVVPIRETIGVIRKSLSRKWPYGKVATLNETKRFLKIYKYRFYKITPVRIWMNDPRAEKDVRVRVRLT
jgi:general stress protein 26